MDGPPAAASSCRGEAVQVPTTGTIREAGYDDRARSGQVDRSGARCRWGRSHGAQASVSLTHLRGLAQPPLAAGRVLAWCQPHPSGEVVAVREACGLQTSSTFQPEKREAMIDRAERKLTGTGRLPALLRSPAPAVSTEAEEAIREAA